MVSLVFWVLLGQFLGVSERHGGERQRVALARALASDPDIMFFDEPLSAIDYQLRKLLEVELKDLHRETGKTFVYITHSLEEAMVMSDRIGIMHQGRLVAVGSHKELQVANRDSTLESIFLSLTDDDA